MSAEAMNLCKQFLDLSKKIAEIDFANENDMKLISSLRESQSYVMAQMDEYKVRSGQELSGSAKALLRQAYDIEERLANRMISLRSEMAKQIQQIQNSKMMRRVYTPVYDQAEGYFIDFQK